MFIPVSIHIKNLTSHTDTFFEFKQGESVLVNGINLDDIGQEKNGSGKSGLTEAISLAITGKTIRDATNRDLITDFKDSGEVIFILFNSSLQKNLNIHRTIFADSNPQTCKVWYDGEKPIVKANVLHYATWILEEIGISEDDFFSYYIITKENYKPFFSITDGSKKTIVNRFSGANEIDKVEPLIKNDLLVQERQKINIDQKIAVERSRLSIFKDDLLELNSQSNSNSIKEAKILKLKEIEGLKEELSSATQSTASNQKEVINLSTKINNFINQYEEQIKVLKVTEEGLEISIRQFKAEIETIEDTENIKVNNINIKVKSKETELKSVKIELNQIEREIQNLENQLLDSISCPHCYKEFNLQDEKLDIDKTRDRTIPDLKYQKEVFEKETLNIDKEIKDLELEIKNLKNLITEKTKNIRENISLEQTKLTAFTIKIKDLVQKKKEEDRILEELVKSKNSKIKLETSLIKNEEDFNTQINIILNSITKLGIVDQDKILELESKIITSQQNLLELEEGLQVIVDEISRLTTWQLNFKKFKSYLANKSLSNISDYTNLFLNKIGSQLSITLDGYRLLSDGKLKEELTTIVNRNGLVVGKYGRFSGGERGRIDFSNILGLQEICNLNAKNGLDLLLLDEALDSLDGLGLGLLMEGTFELSKTIMIISQVSIKSSIVTTLKVIKQNGTSTIN